MVKQKKGKKAPAFLFMWWRIELMCSRRRKKHILSMRDWGPGFRYERRKSLARNSLPHSSGKLYSSAVHICQKCVFCDVVCTVAVDHFYCR